MTGDDPHILVVDDDRRLRELLRRFLSDSGFRVSSAGDTVEARRLLDGIAFDLIVLDVMLPGEDGLAFTASLRAESHVPILLLTARGEVEDRIDGLERGADDYLSKPFEPRELLARIASVLRRAAAAPARAADVLRFGPCQFDPERGELTRDGTVVRLTSQEAGLLRALAANAGMTLSREALIRESGVDANERAVDVQVTRLRRKIEADPRTPRYLQTVRGAGYVLRPQSDRAMIGAFVKRFLPRSLFGRSIMIIVTPLILLQIVSTWIFYDRHWETIERRLANAVAGEIASIIDQRREFPGKEHWVFDTSGGALDLQLAFRPNDILPNHPAQGRSGILDRLLGNALRERVRRPFLLDTWSRPHDVHIQVQLTDGVLDVLVDRERLFSSTTYIFVLWMVGTSLVLFAVATVFMRNQVRPIRRLAAAVDSFGKGRDVPDFRPEGATEIRRAAAAFERMRARIQRMVGQRMEMLAGVSHDLRTPLTRMKLQLAMLDESPEIAGLKADVEEMRKMLDGYLAFARGESAEKVRPTDIGELLRDVVDGARFGTAEIALDAPEGIAVPVRPDALKRCITNLVGNAIRHARHIAVRAERNGDTLEITVDDDGPGIPPAERESVFRPFYRLDPSRNPETGGTGLGLTIARDVARGHGGDLTIEDAPLGGVRARLRLPA